MSGILLFFRFCLGSLCLVLPPRSLPSVKRLVMLALFCPAFFFLQLSHWLGFLLDEILFRGYRKVEVREPLFVVGIPRSGTTLLHRVLARDEARFTTFSLWELILAPSVSQRMFWLTLGRIDRFVGRPLGRVFSFIERRVFGSLDAIHNISLSAPEEDYFTLLPVLGCFLLVLPFPNSRLIWQLARFDTEVPEADRRRIMRHYRRCLQRHLYVRGPEKQLLSKNPSFTPMMRSLAETFPDARFICCVRTPLQTVPSLVSSMQTGAKIFDSDRRGALAEHLTAMLAHFYDHLINVTDAWPDSRYHFSLMDELKVDVGGTVAKFYGHFDWTIDDAYAACLAEESEASRKYKSGHKYSLQQFALTPEEIHERFQHAIGAFDFEIPSAQAAVPSTTTSP